MSIKTNPKSQQYIKKKKRVISKLDLDIRHCRISCEYINDCRLVSEIPIFLDGIESSQLQIPEYCICSVPFYRRLMVQVRFNHFYMIEDVYLGLSHGIITLVEMVCYIHTTISNYPHVLLHILYSFTFHIIDFSFCNLHSHTYRLQLLYIGRVPSLFRRSDFVQGPKSRKNGYHKQ